MILIQDNILPKELLMGIRQSAIEGGFGNWTPPSRSLGYSSYKGMGFHGHHAALHISISKTLRQNIYPNLSFFKISTEDDNHRLIHSDRNDGSFTSIIYLSEHEDLTSGTGFYSHNETGLYEMPTLQEMNESGNLTKWDEDMHDESKWSQVDFVSGKFGRILIFTAPLFHGRLPFQGIGTTEENARMIHVCHFEI